MPWNLLMLWLPTVMCDRPARRLLVLHTLSFRRCLLSPDALFLSHWLSFQRTTEDRQLSGTFAVRCAPGKLALSNRLNPSHLSAPRVARGRADPLCRQSTQEPTGREAVFRRGRNKWATRNSRWAVRIVPISQTVTSHSSMAASAASVFLSASPAPMVAASDHCLWESFGWLDLRDLASIAACCCRWTRIVYTDMPSVASSLTQPYADPPAEQDDQGNSMREADFDPAPLPFWLRCVPPVSRGSISPISTWIATLV